MPNVLKMGIKELNGALKNVNYAKKNSLNSRNMFKFFYQIMFDKNTLILINLVKCK